MNSMVRNAGLILMVISLFGCNKQAADHDAPGVYMISPVQNMMQAFSDDPELHLEFTLNDASHIESLNMVLRDSVGNRYYEKALSPHVRTFPFHTHLTMTKPAAANAMWFELQASDVAGNRMDTVIAFRFNP